MGCLVESALVRNVTFSGPGLNTHCLYPVMLQGGDVELFVPTTLNNVQNVIIACFECVMLGIQNII